MIITVDNQAAYIYTAGHRIQHDKPTVLFIHGAANDHSVWNTQCRYFSTHGWNALAIDLPAHGKTNGVALNSISALSEWIKKCAEVLELKKLSIVGHSMGSLIGLELASKSENIVNQLVLVGTNAPMPVSDQLLETSKNKPELAYHMINQYSFSSRAKLGKNDIPGMSMQGVSIKLMQRTNPGVLHADFIACNSYVDGLSAAEKIACPTLLLLGAHDRMTPASRAKNLEDAIPNSTVKILSGTGHALMTEQPNRITEHLKAFLMSA
jgi:pimeloyl-ACP methyl ester carboxylesterase